IAAAIAGAIVIGQAVFRYLGGAASPEFLGQLGLTRSGIALAYTLPLVAATAVGVAVAVVGAVVTSPLLPIGLARRAEVDSGIRGGGLVLLGLSVLAVAVVCGFAFMAARQVSGHGRGTARAARRAYADAGVTRASLSPVVATGVRFAVERRSGTRTIPIR